MHVSFKLVPLYEHVVGKSHFGLQPCIFMLVVSESLPVWTTDERGILKLDNVHVSFSFDQHIYQIDFLVIGDASYKHARLQLLIHVY